MLVFLKVFVVLWHYDKHLDRKKSRERRGRYRPGIEPETFVVSAHGGPALPLSHMWCCVVPCGAMWCREDTKAAQIGD